MYGVVVDVEVRLVERVWGWVEWLKEEKMGGGGMGRGEDK